MAISSPVTILDPEVTAIGSSFGNGDRAVNHTALGSEVLQLTVLGVGQHVVRTDNLGGQVEAVVMDISADWSTIVINVVTGGRS